jgi:pimeloyl-ACP methyl ester carboxylesterase
MVSVGSAIYLGTGVPEDPQGSIEWFERAAALDDASALEVLAAIYSDDLHVEQDDAKAAQFMLRAAKLGNIAGMQGLIYALAEGVGVPEDDRNANEWRETLYGLEGSPEVAREIAYAYARGGAHMAADPAVAMQWFEVAADGGDDTARLELARRLHWGYGGSPDADRAAELLAEVSSSHQEYADRFDSKLVSRANITLTECPFEKDTGQEVICFDAVLPQDYGAEKSPTVTIPFSLWRAFYEPGEDHPVVIPGGGGPGGPVGLDGRSGGLESAEMTMSLSNGSDLLVIEQRGAGESTPKLICPELSRIYKESWSILPNERDGTLGVDASNACFDRLLDQGVRVQSFNTQSSARDFEEIRKALGFKQWKVLGTSYGARVALRMAQDYPDAVDSLILDSPDSPTDDPSMFMHSVDVENVLRRISVACESSDDCNAEFQTLRSDWQTLIERLQEHPLKLTITHPKTLEDLVVYLDEEDFLHVVLSLAYWDSPALPRAITALAKGSSSLFASLVQHSMLFDDDFSDVLYDVIVCQEQYPLVDLDAHRHRIAKLSIGRRSAEEVMQNYESICQNLNKGESIRVTSWGLDDIEVPTLVLSGTLDPITSTASAKTLADALPNAWFQEFENCGHGVLSCSSCAIETFWRFLDQPENDPRNYYCGNTERKTWWSLRGD